MPQHGPQFLKIVQDAKTRIREVTVADVERKLRESDQFVLIDVREDNEWTKGHLPKAVHMGRGVLERDIEQQIPDPQTEIILYCGGGYRSALAADNLQTMGYKNVYSMDGGYRGWRQAGLPIEE
jgi:rhodanese-related sulfurtransferase